MGMSASQARLLSLTARLSDLEYSAQQVSNSKVRLAMESEDITNKYVKDLDAKKLTIRVGFEGNNPIYKDLSYGLLTGPNDMLSTQYGLSDNYGRLLVTQEMAGKFLDPATKKPVSLAQFLTANGASSGYTPAVPASPDYQPAVPPSADYRPAVPASNDYIPGTPATPGRPAIPGSPAIPGKPAVYPQGFNETTYFAEVARLEARVDAASLTLGPAPMPEEDAPPDYMYEKNLQKLKNAQTVLDNFTAQYTPATPEIPAVPAQPAIPATPEIPAQGTAAIPAQGTPGSPQIGTPGTPAQGDPNDAGNATTQHYTNIYNRMLSGYVTMQDESNTINNPDWIYSQIKNGAIHLEKTDKDNKWTDTTWQTNTDIIEEDDDSKRAMIKAKYDADLTKIQNTDKKFDLDLKQIDTEHNAIQTEFDSVKSVISKNIERSFKTFG